MSSWCWLVGGCDDLSYWICGREFSDYVFWGLGFGVGWICCGVKLYRWCVIGWVDGWFDCLCCLFWFG